MLTKIQQSYNHKILCYYFNASSELQILKIKSRLNQIHQQVVLPKQRLLFESFPNSFLEVYRKTFTGTDLVDKISCNCLQVVNETTVNQ